MSSGPTVALIIAAKNAAETIGRAVASALDQAPIAEVIVVVDGATDDTAAAARACDDGSGRLIVLELPRNVGPAAARNRGLARTSASLVGVLDADDYLEPGRVAAMLAEAPAEWDILADNMVMKRMGEEAEPGELLIKPDPVGTRLIDAETFARANITVPGKPRRELGFLKPLFRREFLTRLDLAYDESLRLGEDFALYAEALIRGGVFVLVRACGYVAVERPNSLSAVHGADDLAAQVEADRRLIALAKGQPRVVAALAEHLHATRLKADYRYALAAKKAGDYAKAFAHLFKSPATTAYILTQTARAWASRLRQDRLA